MLAAAGGAALGWRWADPVVGLAITAAIAWVLYSAAKEIFARLLDAVDPHLIEHAEQAMRDSPGVRSVARLRMRWVGHSLTAETDIDVDPGLSLIQAHTVAHDAEHRLIHALPRLAGATVHAHPAGSPGREPHDVLAHHRHTGSRPAADARRRAVRQ